MNEAQAWLAVVEALRAYVAVTEQEAQYMRHAANESTEVVAWDYAQAVAQDVAHTVQDMVAARIEEVAA